ncbi:MAG TPA: hypothetical protein DEP38_15315 [Cyanobacteria bacterium UBA9226]|nr:hypothetical protein [Cyanobacteria bacterium UBA9226]
MAIYGGDGQLKSRIVVNVSGVASVNIDLKKDENAFIDIFLHSGSQVTTSFNFLNPPECGEINIFVSNLSGGVRNATFITGITGGNGSLSSIPNNGTRFCKIVQISGIYAFQSANWI